MLFAADFGGEVFATGEMRESLHEARQAIAHLGAMPTAATLTAIYLLALRSEIRDVLISRFPGADLNIITRVALPFDQIELPNVKTEFERVLAAIEDLERAGTTTDSGFAELVEIVQTAISRAEYDEARNSIFAIPEARASLAGYERMDRRKAGYHALYDIGEGTTDVCIMKLVEPRSGLPEVHFPAAHSYPRGLNWLAQSIRARMQMTQQQFLGLARGDRKPASTEQDIVADVLTEFAAATKHSWYEAYRKHRSEGSWSGQVSVFLAGGGARFAGINHAVSQAWMSAWPKREVSVLPPPTDYAYQTSAPFERMCVAYGLALPLEEMGESFAPADVPDTTPVRVVKQVAPGRNEVDQLGG